jgi:tetratricopeptide (TPR) repeat protein
LITPEEGAVLLEELEATAPFIEQQNDDETSQALRAAMTDAELFISYNMPAKALEPLISVLPKAPRDLRVNQKLAALQTRAGRFAEAAACCRTLESIYQDAQHSEEGARYGDLAAKYEQRSGGAPELASRLPMAADNPHAPEFEISAPVADPAEHEDASHLSSPGAASEKHPAASQEHAEPVVSATPSGVFFHVPGTPSAVPQPASRAVETGHPPAAPEPQVQAEAPGAEAASEWEDHLEVQGPAAVEATAEEPPVADPALSPAETPAGAAEVEIISSRPSQMEESIEEVRFYLGQGMIDQADHLLRKLEGEAPELAELAMLRVGVDSARQAPEAAAAETEIAIERPEQGEAEPPVIEGVTEEPRTAPAGSGMTQPWPQVRPAPAQAPQQKVPAERRPALQELVSDLEESLGDDFLASEGAQPSAPAPKVHAQVPRQMEPAREPSGGAGQEFRSNSLDDFVSDLEASLGTETAAQPEQPALRASAPLAQAAAAATGQVAHAPTMPGAPAKPRAPQPPAHTSAPLSGAGIDLAGMFGELKQELEDETAGVDEDPETHYNLGVAFREMGLLDEAIGEFQKVTQAAEHGHAFSQLMQTYTWLAQCFLDKGVPQAGVRWYEAALKMPGIDQETRTALHYELACAWESAGNKAAALNNFLEAYSSNIDYRDVAERIKALRS